MNEARNEREWLELIYNQALDIYENDARLPALANEDKHHLQTILEHQENRKGILAVLVTLLVKKLHTPSQDIRLHQAKFEGGFSGRTLDTKVVTPFLREKRFPHMSESGWLTRSLEQAHPYDREYPGSIRPPELKSAFLGLIHSAQERGWGLAEHFLLVLFVGLIGARDRNKNLVLSRPVNLSVAEVVDKLKQHCHATTPGASRLPVLAIYSILGILARETERYRDCEVLPLEAHTAADSRTRLVGDVNIVDANGALFEGYEIKHNVPITVGLIQTSFEKLQTTPVERFYILTTYSQEDYGQFDSDIRRVARTHGCQLIVNGVDCTLAYYLRLINNTREFVNAYVTNLETDPAINFDLKESWNQIAAQSDMR